MFNQTHVAEKRSRAGFSLLELLMTLVIIGAISAIAMPRYLRSAANFQTEAAARRIIADLRFAREHAMQTSTPTTVRFDVGNDRYELLGVPDPDHGTTPYTIDLPLPPYRTHLVGAALGPADASEPLVEVVFDIYGRPDSDGAVVVTSGGSTRTVLLDPETGKASLE